MKKFWKALGITALAAAVVPYRFRKDEETGTSGMDALLWQVSRRPGDSETKDIVDISLGFKSPFQERREEQKLFTDDPEEAVLFADDEPEAAVVDAPLTEAVAGAVAGAAEAVEATIEEVISETEDDKAGFDPEA